MEGANLEGANSDEIVQPHVENAEAVGGPEVPREEAPPQVDGAQGPSANWNGYRIPIKRKPDVIKGSSKKRKQDSKLVPPPEMDEARAPARAPARAVLTSSERNSSESESSSDNENSSDDDRDSSDEVESDLPDDVFVNPREAPAPAARAAQPAYTRFDPGVGDSVIFKLPTQEMNSYASKLFTEYVPEICA